jgi:hypothetical protein
MQIHVDVDGGRHLKVGAKFRRNMLPLSSVVNMEYVPQKGGPATSPHDIKTHKHNHPHLHRRENLYKFAFGSMFLTDTARPVVCYHATATSRLPAEAA